MTNSNGSGILSKAQQKDQIRRDFNSKYKKYYPKVTDKTRRLSIEAFPNFVAELISIPLQDAVNMIKNYEITVNGDIVIDVNYQLKVGDIVRGDIGHKVNNSPFMAVVK